MTAFGCERVGRAEIGGKRHGCEIELGAERAVGEAGDAEVGKKEMSVGIDEDVLGLDVAVDDAAAVAERERIAEFGVPRADGFVRRRFERGEAVGKRTVPDEVHDVEGTSVGERAAVGYAHDVRMPQRREDAGFGEEFVGKGSRLFAGRSRVEDLHGVSGLQSVVNGFVDDGHSAASEFPSDRIAGYRNHRAVSVGILRRNSDYSAWSIQQPCAEVN